jgi:hypothetical protein
VTGTAIVQQIVDFILEARLDEECRLGWFGTA